VANKELLRKEYCVFQRIMALVCCLILAISIASIFFLGVDLWTIGAVALCFSVYNMRLLKRKYKKKFANSIP